VTKDQTFYVIVKLPSETWTVVEKECTVTFDSNGGSTVETQTIEYAADSAALNATKPADPIKSGYRFLGWYLN